MKSFLLRSRKRYVGPRSVNCAGKAWFLVYFIMQTSAESFRSAAATALASHLRRTHPRAANWVFWCILRASGRRGTETGKSEEFHVWIRFTLAPHWCENRFLPPPLLGPSTQSFLLLNLTRKVFNSLRNAQSEMYLKMESGTELRKFNWDYDEQIVCIWFDAISISIAGTMPNRKQTNKKYRNSRSDSSANTGTHTNAHHLLRIN